MSVDKKFLKQVKNNKVKIVEIPRQYISWENTETGRDKTDCYERISSGGLDESVYYVNTNNKTSLVHKTNPFFETLEHMYFNSEIIKSDNGKIFDAKKEFPPFDTDVLGIFISQNNITTHEIITCESITETKDGKHPKYINNQYEPVYPKFWTHLPII